MTKLRRGRLAPPSRLRRQTLWIIIAILWAPPVMAQMTIGVSSQEGSDLTISTNVVRFDLTEQGYPPPKFPAYYLPVTPDPAVPPMWISVFTDLPAWTINADFDQLYDVDTNNGLSVSQMEYSTDVGVNWFPFTAGVTTLIQGIAATTSTETYPLSLRLKLNGDELPGRYEGSLVLSLSSN